MGFNQLISSKNFPTKKMKQVQITMHKYLRVCNK